MLRLPQTRHKYHLNFAAEDLDFILSIEADRFQNLDYTQDEFKTETGAVLGEFLGSKSSPHHWLNEKLQKTAFEKHTYRHTTMGFEKDIRNMPSMYEYSLSFYERYYRPENTVLLILGDINLREVLRASNKALQFLEEWIQSPPKCLRNPAKG